MCWSSINIHEHNRDLASSMFNGPCQLHGSAGFISSFCFAVDADDALLTPTGSSSRYVNSGVITGMHPPPHSSTATDQHPYGLRPRLASSGAGAATAGGAAVPPLSSMSDLPQPCSADRCLMSPGLTCPDVYMALEGVQFLAEHTRREQYTIRVLYYYIIIVRDSLKTFFFLKKRKEISFHVLCVHLIMQCMYINTVAAV